MAIDNNLYEKSIKILTELIAFQTVSGTDNSDLINYCEKILNDLGIKTFKVFDEIITVTHGDQFGSMPSHSKLRDTFPDSKLIIYGHTHFQIFDDSESPWVMNPGASGHTRNMNGGPCLSLIHI